jgi:hypothetical protein
MVEVIETGPIKLSFFDKMIEQRSEQQAQHKQAHHQWYV